MRTHRLLASAIVGVLLTPATLRAQAEPASIPTTLVKALLGDPYRAPNGLKITVGEPPAGFPAELVPRSMTVLGGTSRAGQMVVIMRDSTQPPLGVFQRLLRERGFTAPTQPDGFGFLSSGSPGNYLCRDSASVSAWALRVADTEQLLQVSYTRGVNSACGRRSFRRPPSPFEKPRLEIPLMAPPPGATSVGSSGSAGSDVVEADATVTDSSRTAVDLVRYYIGLLAAKSWTASPPVGDARIAAASLAAKDTSGRAWMGSLTVASEGKSYMLTLRMKPTEAR